MQRPLEQRLNALGLIVGPAAVLIVFMAMAGRSGPGSPHMGLDAFTTLMGSLPLVAAWLLAAIGLGWPLRRWLAPAPGNSEPAALQIALGVAAMLTLDSALGRSGLLQVGGSVGAWLLIIIGWLLLIEQVRRRGFAREVDVAALAPHWLVWSAAPAIAVMLLATTSAPGWLWDTEYGGYDALSYHLQLPKEWMAMGAMSPAAHNVYSFFPGAMEGAFYHVMVLRGDAVRAAYACQLLHAVVGVCAAWVVGRVVVRVLAERAKPQAAGAVAFVVVMGTPWVVVAGSMAYNEMAALLMFAAGLLVIVDEGLDHARRATLVGFFAGVACAAKLTAVGFVAAPLGLLLLTIVPRRDGLRVLPAAALAAALALSPYFLINAIATGNPVFPFATGIFGTGHWSAEQAGIWRDGHRSELGIGRRAVEGWHQLMRFGIGPAPPHEERWHAQWSILPWLTIAALIALIARRSSRRWGLILLMVIAMQIVFWLALTHIKSRFMLPMVVPGAIAIALAMSSFPRSASSSFPRRRESSGSAARSWMFTCAGMTIALLLWSIVPAYLFARQAGGAPAAAIGMAQLMTGEALSQRQREATGRAESPVIYINHLLPEGSRVLFIGEAAPFYYRAQYTYNTVWDRGPLSRLMREHPDDPAAWFGALRDDGYTHVLVDPVMLERWDGAGWNDPLLTAQRVMEAMAVLELAHRWERGIALFRIP